MANYIYKAVDPQTRKHISVNITASSETEANRLIIEKGLKPLSVKEAKSFNLRGVVSGVKRKEKIIFTNQLSTLIGAGLPLLQSLKSTAEQTKNRELKKIVSEVVTGIEGGVPFSDALARYPKVFDTIFISLVRAGEASGTLDVSLERLATQQEKDGDLISKVKSAMVYPVIVVLVMIGVVVFMLVAVLPQVESFYDGLDGDNQLPLITRILLVISNTLRDYWFFIILGVAAAAGSFLTWVRTKSGKSVIDRLKISGPAIKSLYQKVYMARFTRTVGTLFGSGVNLIQTLEIIQAGINNIYMTNSIQRSVAQVQEGQPFSQSLRNDPNFLDLVPDMIQIGEQSGKTEEMLMKAAVYYEKEVDKQIKLLTTIMEPVLILGLGGIALTIVLAILLPIYQVVQKGDLF